MSILDSILNGIARAVHPEHGRDGNVELPSDISGDEVAERLDEAADEQPQFANWRTSVVDLLKLTHRDDPTTASSFENRKALAEEVGIEDYTGTDEQNNQLHEEVMKALRERGIELPGSDE